MTMYIELTIVCKQFTISTYHVISNHCEYNFTHTIILLYQPIHTEKHNSTSWTYFIAAAFVFVMTLTLFLNYPGYFNLFDRYQSKSLIHTSKIFVGREQEKSQLMTLLDFRSGSTDIRIVNIVGSPGFGKSTLAIHV